MKILYLISNSSLDERRNTGYARHIRETVKWFERNGHEVSIVRANPVTVKESEQKSSEQVAKANPLNTFLSSAGLQIVWETIKDFRLLRINKKFRRAVENQIRKYQPDIIYERATYLSSVGVECANDSNIPILIEVNSPFTAQRVDLSGKSLLTIMGRSKERSIYTKSNGILTVSNALKEYVADFARVPQSKILVNQNGVDGEMYSWAERHSSPNGSEQVVFGFIGSIMPYHGIESLIEVFSKVSSKRPNTKLLVVGDGQTLSKLKEMAVDLGCSHSVEFTGSIPHDLIHEQLERMDIGLLPSTKWYCSPIKIFEYGLFAKAILSVNEPAVAEVITHNKSGLLFSSQGEMEEAMLRLIDEPELRIRLGEEAQGLVKASYTWEANSLRIQRAIDQL